MTSLETGDQIRNIIAENIDLQNFSEEELGEVISRLQSNIEQKINLTIIDGLANEDRDILFGLTDTSDIDAFLRNKIVDLDALVRETALLVIKEFKEATDI